MRIVAICCCLLVLACTRRDLEPVAELKTGDTVEVRSIVKGDELMVERNGLEASVRLLGIHAFEAVMDDLVLERLRQPVVAYVTTATQSSRVEVTLGSTPRDRHGRYLAYVTHEGADFNRDLVAKGYVLVYTEFPFAREAEYLAAEGEARAAKKGIWGDAGARKMLVGLRKVWADARQTAVDDPLLAQSEGESAEK